MKVLRVSYKGENKMDNNVLDKFGKIFIDEVRDYTMDIMELILNGKMGGLVVDEIKSKISEFDKEDKEVISMIVSEAITTCMHHMLVMCEQHEEIQLLYNSKDLDEESDGLCGELYTEDGWIYRFSKQKYKDKYK